MAHEIFLSYTSVKDPFGEVTGFRDHLENRVRQTTGEVHLTVFQDKLHIEGGDNWQEILASEIRAAKLFVLMLSPTWVRSAWCRREYQLFTETVGTDKRARPVVPVLWDRVFLDRIAHDAEAVTIYTEITQRYQLIDWTNVKLEDWNSTAAKTAIGELAEVIAHQLFKSDAFAV